MLKKGMVSSIVREKWNKTQYVFITGETLSYPVQYFNRWINSTEKKIKRKNKVVQLICLDFSKVSINWI